MSKPHEEQWMLEEVIVMHNRHDGQKEAREVLGHAAPDMARALALMLASLRENGGRSSRERTAQCGHAGECRFQRAARAIDATEAALTKAGVPLT